MPLLTNRQSHPLLPALDLPTSCPDCVVGAAVFDLNGLPKEYFTTSDMTGASWVQTIFQALGLRSLLMSSLQLEGFHHATIHGVEYSAVVVKQRAHYAAFLVRPQDETLSETFIQWVKTAQPNELKQNPRFQVI